MKGLQEQLSISLVKSVR